MIKADNFSFVYHCIFHLLSEYDHKNSGAARAFFSDDLDVNYNPEVYGGTQLQNRKPWT